jgi:hypothetical protein
MKEKIFDVMQKTVVLGLFSVTLAGAFFTSRGAYGIIYRRIENGPEGYKPKVVDADAVAATDAAKK